MNPGSLGFVPASPWLFCSLVSSFERIYSFGREGGFSRLTDVFPTCVFKMSVVTPSVSLLLPKVSGGAAPGRASVSRNRTSVKPGLRTGCPNGFSPADPLVWASPRTVVSTN